MTPFRALLRPLVVTALMVCSSLVSVVALPSAKLSDTRRVFQLEQAVPTQFGEWQIDNSVVPLPPSPDQQAVLNEIYDQILSRTYINPRGERMMLSITYGSRQNQQMRAHRQEVCYSAQGFKVTGVAHQIIQVAGGPVSATRMLATQGPRIEPVTYWFTMGDQVVLTYFEREWAQFKYTLSGYIPDGYLVRISSLSAEGDAAFPRHLAFADALVSSLEPELRQRLTGHR
jgi:EpsI family protein